MVMRVRLVLLITAGFVAGCSISQPNRGSTAIEPKANLEAGAGCTTQLGIAKVNAFFAALNQGDSNSAVAMFPDDGDGFVIQPELEATEFQLTAATLAEVRAGVHQLAGLHFVFTEPLPAKAGRFDYYLAGQKASVLSVAVGPVIWKASGGGRSYSGGGKITFNCESGKFLRVLF